MAKMVPVTMRRAALTFAMTLALVTTASAFSIAPRSSWLQPALSSPLFRKKVQSPVGALESSVGAVSTTFPVDSTATLGPIASAMTKVSWLWLWLRWSALGWTSLGVEYEVDYGL